MQGGAVKTAPCKASRGRLPSARPRAEHARPLSGKIKDVPPTERFCGRHAFYNIPLLFSIPISTTMTSAATQTPIKTSMYFSGTLRNFS